MDEKLIRQTLETAKQEAEKFKEHIQNVSLSLNHQYGILLGKVAALEALLAPPEVKKDKKEKEE